MNKIYVALLVLLIPVGLFFGHAYLVNRDNSMIEIGRAEREDEFAALQNANALLKRETELRLQQEAERLSNEASRKLKSQEASRLADDEVARANIELMIQKDPEFYTNKLCTMPPALLAERNRIRDNG